MVRGWGGDDIFFERGRGRKGKGGWICGSCVPWSPRRLTARSLHGSRSMHGPGGTKGGRGTATQTASWYVAFVPTTTTAARTEHRMAV